MKNDLVLSRRKALILATVLSLVLFGAGLLSGLSVAKLNEQRTKIVEEKAQLAEQKASNAEQQTSQIAQKTERDLTFLSTYVGSLDSELRSLQLQDAFVRSLDDRQRCAFADSYFSEVATKLNGYWAVLPYRLEEYEQERNLSTEYLKLKSEYTKLSVEAWLIARENHGKCRTTALPILYFYEPDCSSCVAQGEVLDQVKRALAVRNESALVFTVDREQQEPALRLILMYYGISSAPALVINERVLQGRLYTDGELLAVAG